MDDLVYLIYVMFSLQEITLGMVLFVVGCVMIAVVIFAALIMAATAGSSKSHLEEKMRERY